MKIAMIGHKRIPSREGGVEIVVEALSRRMVQRGHRVTVYNRKSRHVAGTAFDDHSHLHNLDGVQIRWVPTPNSKKLNAIVYSFFATVQALFGGYDIIHFHAEGPAAMVPLAKCFGKKCVVTIHGLDWQRAKWGGFATRLSRFGLEKDSYILFLGRIVPEKGIHYLIDAYHRLQTDKKLVIAGGASHSEEYFNQLKTKAAGDARIVFTDFVQGAPLAALYAGAYLYCLPSDLEGMPISLLEAMSYGNCCVTSDIPECTEVCGDHGFAFQKGNTADLKRLLEQLLSQPDLVKCCKATAADYILQKYNWDQVTERTLELYEQVKSAK